VSGVFGRLSPFIQEYVYSHGWDELREIQVEACKVIFDSDMHLLLASGTASGKTEAAFLPVLTEITNDPPQSVAVLYIAPIKALINDQFIRLNDLLKEADVPVWYWHGDVPPSHKKKMLNNPGGVLQITPESLENMLLNKSGELIRLFGDLRFVIIDEVHNFMGSDRGMQVLCQLERLRWHTRSAPRRIGLSATLGDYTLASEWLATGTGVKVAVPAVRSGHKNIRLAVEHFYESEDAPYLKAGAEHASEVYGAPPAGAPPMVETETYSRAAAFWEYLYDHSLHKKCIIFVNLRNDAEMAIAMLRQMAELRGMPDVYHVHHGSISAALREGAESDMKTGAGPTVIAATLTLEMGIDIGHLETILQLNAPNSVSSFLQRLGRSGRRGQPAEMWFLCKEEKPSGVPLPPQQMPWRLLQAIGVLQLYIEDRWVESPLKIKYPLSLLYHQTMSVISAYGEITAEALAGRVLSMGPFNGISIEDYYTLLSYLVENGHLQHMEDGGLIVGLEGEKLTNNYKFLAVFADEENEYVLFAESRPVGKIENPPPPGERVTLAGRTWEVTEVDSKRRIVFVERVCGKVRTYWKGGGSKIDNRVLEKMRAVLKTDAVYQYLQSNAKVRLAEARFLCRHSGLADYEMVSLGGYTLCVLPWFGTVDFVTLLYLMRKYLGSRLDARSVGGWTPYFITAKIINGTVFDVLSDLKELFGRQLDIVRDITDGDLADLKAAYEYKPPKFDAFVPFELQKKAVVEDYFNLERIKNKIDGWQCGELGQ